MGRRPTHCPPAYVVEQAARTTTRLLRQQVLRPGQPVGGPLPGDEDPTAVHFAAHDAVSSEVTGTGVVLRQPPPWDPTRGDAWRLRGLATAEARRGERIGSAVLAAAVAYVRRQRGTVVWCHAPTAARAFFERAGFVGHGEPWVDPELGPRLAMSCELPALDRS